MGRRKIEIQPITVRFLSVRSSHSLTRPQHERNRSVTFLKVRPPLRLFSSLTRFQRKNGLFKKAYELGVLCSVDVAVIVFDNKQGGPRLYQYGSDDVITIVERAMRVRATPLSSDVRSTPFSPVRGRSGHQTALRFQRSVASRPRRGRGRRRGPSPVSDVQEADRVRLDQAHTHSPNPATTILRLSSSAQARPCRIHRNPLRGNSCRKQLGPRWAPSPGPYSPVTSTPSRSVPPVPGALHKPSVLDSSALQHGPTTTPTVTFPRLSYRPPEPPPIRGTAFCWSLRSPAAEPKPRSLRQLPGFSCGSRLYQPWHRRWHRRRTQRLRPRRRRSLRLANRSWVEFQRSRTTTFDEFVFFPYVLAHLLSCLLTSSTRSWRR